MTNTESTTAAKIEALAALISEDTKRRYAEKYSQWQADEVSITVKPGRVYTKIDRNRGGMLMVRNADGAIFGIKGYGQVHLGHQYGSLETITDWYWGEYYPELASTTQRDQRNAVTESVNTTPAPRNDPTFEVGDGATVHIGTDAWAATVIAVSDSGKTLTIQGDTATLSPDFTPDFSPGGFCGHVGNQDQQSYTYTPNPDAVPVKVRLTDKGWSANGLPVTKGRRAFHDYNF